MADDVGLSEEGAGETSPKGNASVEASATVASNGTKFGDGNLPPGLAKSVSYNGSGGSWRINRKGKEALHKSFSQPVLAAQLKELDVGGANSTKGKNVLKMKSAPMSDIIRELRRDGRMPLPRSLEEEAGQGKHRASFQTSSRAVSSTPRNRFAKFDRVMDRVVLDRFRELVSKKKRRFKQEDFNLDLSYITERVISMGFPSESTQGLFRNPMKQVVQLLEKKHPNHYKVYNLCSEASRKYPKSKFPTGVVEDSLCFPDHNPPPFELIEEFCRDALDWLKSDPKNVLVVHCKAGKGRTGTLISCLFLYMREFSTAADAMTYFGVMRTINGKGVTIPSQRRYVGYFQLHLSNPQLLPGAASERRIHRLRLNRIPTVGTGASGIFMVVSCGNAPEQVCPEPFASDSSARTPRPLATMEAPLDLPAGGSGINDTADRSTQSEEDDNGGGLVVSGDFRIDVKTRKGGGEPSKLFHFWLHTAFIDGGTVHLEKSELDGGCKKDKKHQTYPEDFSVDLILDEPEQSAAAADQP